MTALQAYQEKHSINNLRKVCVEISDLCTAVYASTENDEERTVYTDMLERLLSKTRNPS